MPNHSGELFWNPEAPGSPNRGYAFEADTYTYVLVPNHMRISPKPLRALFGNLQTMGWI